MSVEHAIVLGAPRSGTTFLMGVLDTLPAVECVSGNLMPVGISHAAAQTLPDGVGPLLERSFRGALNDYLMSSAYRARSAALRKWWLVGHPASGLSGAARGTRTETMLAYKEPFLALAPWLAYRGVPDARLIYIFRDGRDVADSLVRTYDVLSDRKLADLESNEMPLGRPVGDLFVPWWVAQGEEQRFLAARPYVRAIWMWREMIRRCRAFFGEPDVCGSGRVLEVRYEDLVRTPLPEGERITEHLGQHATGRTLARLQSVHPRSIGAHRRRAQEEIEAAERLAGAELQALGYSLSTVGS